MFGRIDSWLSVGLVGLGVPVKVPAAKQGYLVRAIRLSVFLRDVINLLANSTKSNRLKKTSRA